MLRSVTIRELGAPGTADDTQVMKQVYQSKGREGYKKCFQVMTTEKVSESMSESMSQFHFMQIVQ